MEELRPVPRNPVKSQPEEEKRRRIAGTSVGWIVREGWDVTARRLIVSKRYQCAFQSIRKLLVASGQKAKGRNHQVSSIGFRVSPTSGSRKSLKRPLRVMQQDL
jgi:hypothetical protein